MGTTDIVLLIWGLICFLLIGQGCASGYIGNRFYSAWYETHFLIEKKGVTKLIYLNQNILADILCTKFFVFLFVFANYPFGDIIDFADSEYSISIRF